MLPRERVPRRLQLGLHLLRRNPGVLRRAHGRVGPEVDDGDAPAGRQVALQVPEVLLALVDVVVHVDEKHQVHLPRKLRVVEGSLHRLHVRAAFLLRPLREVLHHVGLHVDRVHLALGQHGREPRGEIAGAGADVRHDRAGIELQRRNYLMRLLPGVAIRIVEDMRPLLCVLELMLVGMGRLRVGDRPEKEHQEKNLRQSRPHGARSRSWKT